MTDVSGLGQDDQARIEARVIAAAKAFEFGLRPEADEWWEKLPQSERIRALDHAGDMLVAAGVPALVAELANATGNYREMRDRADAAEAQLAEAKAAALREAADAIDAINFHDAMTDKQYGFDAGLDEAALIVRARAASLGDLPEGAKP